MIKDIVVYRKDQQTVNKWAGGTTTQLAIFPKDAIYSERNFLWRLSTAVVELEQSDFTALPGYDRTLMVLEGELRLVHKGYHSSILKPYDHDWFKGSWDTTSYGTARDFNLMLKEGIKGRLEHFQFAAGEKLSHDLESPDSMTSHFACYCHQGKSTVVLGDSEIELMEKDLLLVQYSEKVELSFINHHLKDCHMICAFVEA